MKKKEIEIELKEDKEEVVGYRSSKEIGYVFNDILNISLSKDIKSLKLKSSDEDLATNLGDAQIQFITSCVSSHISSYFNKDVSDIRLRVIAKSVSDVIFTQIKSNNECKFKDCFVDIIKVGVEAGLGEGNCKKYNFEQLAFALKVQYMQFGRLNHTVDNIYQYLTEVSIYAKKEGNKLIKSVEDKKNKKIKYSNLTEDCELSGYEYEYNKTSISHLKEYFAQMAVELESKEYYYSKALRYILIESDHRKLHLENVNKEDIHNYCGYATDCKLNNFVNSERKILIDKCFDNLLLFLASEQGEIQDKIANSKWYSKVYKVINGFVGAGAAGAGGLGIGAGGTIMIVGGAAGAVCCPPALIAGGVIIGGSVLIAGGIGGGFVVSTSIVAKVMESRESYSYKKMLDIICLIGLDIEKIKKKDFPEIEIESFNFICLNSEHKSLKKELIKYQNDNIQTENSFTNIEDAKKNNQNNIDNSFKQVM